MGYVVLAGLFEPGTAVSLHAARDGVLRAVGPHVGRRLADGDGTVGFDGLEPGARFAVSGFDVYGMQFSLFARALSEGDANDVGQPPIRPSKSPVGSQEAPPRVEAPAVPGAVLHTGVPVGVPVGAALAA